MCAAVAVPFSKYHGLGNDFILVRSNGNLISVHALPMAIRVVGYRCTRRLSAVCVRTRSCAPSCGIRSCVGVLAREVVARHAGLASPSTALRRHAMILSSEEAMHPPSHVAQHGIRCVRCVPIAEQGTSSLVLGVSW